MKIAMSEQKNSLDRINGKLDTAVGKIGAPEDICCRNETYAIQNEKWRKKKQTNKNEKSISNMRDNFK